MGLMQILRKLGIFRSGKKAGTYTNAVNRPTEIQMDGVFDAKQDLINAPTGDDGKGTGHAK